MKRYADDYKVVITEDEKGREKKAAVYQGEYYEIAVDEQSLSKFRQICLILGAMIIFAQVVSGFLANQGMYNFFVSLPYVFSFLPLYFLAAGILRLPAKKRKFRRDEIGLSFERMKTASTFLLILLGIGVVGEITYLVWFMEGWNVLEYIFLLLGLLTTAAVYILIRLLKSMLGKISRIPG